MRGGASTTSQTAGSGWTLSIKTGLVPNLVWEYDWDGSYQEGSPEVQRAAFLRWLHVLDTAECFASVRGCPYAFPVKIDRVLELWDTPEKKWHAIRIITRRIAAQHPYTFAPSDLLEADVSPARPMKPASLESDDQNVFD
jgi:hypothetical protein